MNSNNDINSTIKEIENIFKKNGNPKNNKEFYCNTYGPSLYNTICFLYLAYKADFLYLAYASVSNKTIKETYNGNIDELVDNIKKNKLYLYSNIIYIKEEINNVEELNKLKDTFKDKEIVLWWNNELSFIDDVIDARYMIDYYKSLIDDDLSNLEKIALAYDIIKSHQYNASNAEVYDTKSRYITKLTHNNSIVCSGYVNLFNRILNELNIDAYKLFLDTEIDNNIVGHIRSVVNVNDPKYNLNGLYIFDPTWDSSGNIFYYKNDDNSIRISRIKKDGYKKSDSLSLYKYFLVPFKNYESKFSKSKNEMLRVKNHKVDSITLNKLLHQNQLKIIKNELSPKRFVDLIKIIKLKEGYNKEDIPLLIRESLLLSKYGNYTLDSIINYLNKDVTREL